MCPSGCIKIKPIVDVHGSKCFTVNDKHEWFCCFSVLSCIQMCGASAYISVRWNVSSSYFHNFPSVLGRGKMRGDKSNLKWVSKNVLKHVSVCWCLCWTEYEELPNSGTLSLNANKCRFNVSGCKIHFIGSNLCADIRCLVFQLNYIVMLCSIACFRSFSHQFFGCTVSQRAQQHT